jgi:hypothetical protein
MRSMLLAWLNCTREEKNIQERMRTAKQTRKNNRTKKRESHLRHHVASEQVASTARAQAPAVDV